MPPDQDTARDLFGATLLAAVGAVAAAGGHVDAREVDVICAAVERVTGNQPDRAAVEKAATEAGADHLKGILAGIAERSAA